MVVEAGGMTARTAKMAKPKRASAGRGRRAPPPPARGRPIMRAALATAHIAAAALTGAALVAFAAAYASSVSITAMVAGLLLRWLPE